MTATENATADIDPDEASETQQDSSPDSTPGALIAKLEEEKGALKDQWLRAMAEAENIRKRAARDVEETVKYAVTGIARDLVSVAENLKRALDSIPEADKAEDERFKNIASGVEMTLNELLSVFERNGIKRIDPLGQKFDHNLHQAMMQLDVPDAEPGTIVQVLQAGYTIRDRLLRPALVGVARAGGADAPKTVDTQA